MMIATVKKTAKWVNCNSNHPVFSRDCPTWKKEKAILKVKYEKSITLLEARKPVKEQFAAPGKSYASITKVSGVHVSCTDAQTQTDETCIAELKSATSNAGSKPTLAPPLSGMAQIKMGVVPSTLTQPKLAETKSTPKPAERSLRLTQKTKSTQAEQQRDQMSLLKLTTDMVPLTRTTLRLRFLPAVLVKASLLEYLQLDTYSSNLTTSLRQYNYYQ